VPNIMYNFRAGELHKRQALKLDLCFYYITLFYLLYHTMKKDK